MPKLDIDLHTYEGRMLVAALTMILEERDVFFYKGDIFDVIKECEEKSNKMMLGLQMMITNKEAPN